MQSTKESSEKAKTPKQNYERVSWILYVYAMLEMQEGVNVVFSGKLMVSQSRDM